MNVGYFLTTFTSAVRTWAVAIATSVLAAMIFGAVVARGNLNIPVVSSPPAATRLLVGGLKRLDNANDDLVFGGCSKLILETGVAARCRRVAELSMDVLGPRLTTEVAARRQLKRSTQSCRTVRATCATCKCSAKKERI